MRSSPLKDAIRGLSLANLMMLRVWSALLTRSADFGYTSRYPARPVELAGAILGVCVLAAVFCMGAVLARRSPRAHALMRWTVVMSILVAANAMREVVNNSIATEGAPMRDAGRFPLLAALGGVVAIWIALMFLFRERMARAVSTALVVFSPFVLVTFLQAATGIVFYNPAAYADRKLADRVEAGVPQRRILWLIFDEMDQRMTFVNRDPSLQLPELDRFRAESFYAGDAWSPNRVTQLSLPSLLTGEQVASARPLGPDDLLLTYQSGRTAHWQQEPNFFSRSREAGFDSALAGWLHPYGRMLNRSLTECAWVERPTAYNSLGDTLPDVAINEVRSLVETAALSPFGQSLDVQHQVRNYRAITAAATSYVADPRVAVTFIHFPIPHPPYIYDARTGRTDLTNSPVRGYIDALALADRTFGQFRRAMEAAGLWDRTAILISADHGYRGDRAVDGGKIADRWVPFLLKLPGQHTPYEYRGRLDTIVSSALLLDILKGKIATPAQVAASLPSDE